MVGARSDLWSETTEWPERFIVRLLVGDDLRTTEHEVLTFLGADKAIVLATAMHVRRAGGHVGIHDVAVEALGPAATALNGRPERPPGTLVDHLEFR